VCIYRRVNANLVLFRASALAFYVRLNACLEIEHFVHGCLPQFMFLDSYKLRPEGAVNSTVLATEKSWGKYSVNCSSVSAFVSFMSQEVVT